MQEYSVFILAFILGIKHAIEPDHIVAVSTIVCKTKKIRKASILGALWGIGHTGTLFIVGMIGIMMKYTIPKNLTILLERGVGIMIIILSIKLLLDYKVSLHNHVHPYEHTSKNDHNSGSKQEILEYTNSLFIGFVHGLAGSAAMTLLTLSTVESYFDGALFILFFGIGTIFSMLVYTTILGIPFVINNNEQVHKYMNISVGIIGLIFGFYYILF